MSLKISKFKKIGCAVAAVALALPMALAGNTYADEGACEGPANLSELQTLLNQRVSDQEITLCGDIDGQFMVYRRMTTIDLNGFSLIAPEGGAFARVSEQGQLTITGTGNVYGRMSGGFNYYGNISFFAEGGTYTDGDVADFVVEDHAAYEVDGEYRVEPELTNENFVVSGENEVIANYNGVEVNEGIFVHKGETGQINVTLPEGSTSGVTYVSDNEDIATVDENGVVTAVENGWVYVEATSTYDENVGGHVVVTIYSVEPTDPTNEGEIGAAENVRGWIEEALSGDNEELLNRISDAIEGNQDYPAARDLQEAVYFGETINTEVIIEEAVLTDSERAEMVALMGDVSMDNVKFYDVTVDLSVDYGGDELYWVGTVHEFDTPIRVLVAEVGNPASGYARTYFAVSNHGGEPVLLTEGEDFEIVDGKFYLISNKFSVFALGFKDTLLPKTPDTGAYTAETEAAADNSAVMMVVAIAAIVTVAGVAVFAKRK